MALTNVVKRCSCYGSDCKQAGVLEKISARAVEDWNDDPAEGSQPVIRCINADSEYLDRCDQYVIGTEPLCDKCRGRQEREEERTYAERGSI